MLSSLILKRTAYVVGVLALIIFAGMYMAGLFCWRHESYAIKSTHPFSRSRWGAAFGPKQVYLRAGDTLNVSYDAEVRRGHLTMHVFKPFKRFGSELGESRNVHATSKGQFTFPIRESCYYVLSIQAYPGSGGCDLSYDATWSRR